MAETKTPGRLSSVDRAVTMVETLASSGGLTITQLASRMGSGKATAFRLAGTLVERGWLVKDEELRYRLGPGVLRLSAARREVDLSSALRSIMVELHETVRETIHLTRLDGRQIVYLDQLVSPQPVHSVAVIGSRSPAHCVSPGLAQLARQSEDMLDWILAAPLQRYTEHSPRDASEVHRRIDAVRERGYAVNVGGYRVEVGGVGVAVDGGGDLPVAALSVCMPTYRMKSLDVDALGSLLLDAAKDASQRLRLARNN